MRRQCLKIEEKKGEATYFISDKERSILVKSVCINGGSISKILNLVIIPFSNGQNMYANCLYLEALSSELNTIVYAELFPLYLNGRHLVSLNY